MKKVLIVALAVVMVSVSSIFAQDNPKNIIKWNLGSLIVATYNFQFEHAVGEKQSVQLGLFYTGFKVTDTKFTGFGITPEYRFYMSQKGAPKGFFAAPFLRYQSFTLSNSISDMGATAEAKAKLSTMGGGLIIGFQGLMGPISIETFIGPYYNAGSVKVETEGYESSNFSTGAFGSGLRVRAGFTVGFAF